MTTNPGVSSALARIPAVGNAVLNQAEALWLASCFDASAGLCDG